MLPEKAPSLEVLTAEAAAKSSKSSKSVHAEYLKTIPLDDFGVLNAFARVHENKARYVSRWDAWVVWDGLRWVEDDGGTRVQRLYQALIEDLESTGREGIAKFCTSCRSVRKSQSILTGAAKELNVRPEEFDKDQGLLNTRAGVIDLRTGEILCHDPRRLITKLAPFDIAGPDEPCPKWDRFLFNVANGRQDVADALRVHLGYMLIGGNPAQKAFVWTGLGKNGKSTLAQAMALILGDYAGVLHYSTLVKQRYGPRPLFGLEQVRGCRMVSTSEPDAGMQLDESLFKQITGSASVQVEAKHQRPFEMPITFKLVLDCNARPGVEWGRAMDRRFLVVPFDYEVPEEERQLEFERVLVEEEGPQILRELVQGAVEFYRRLESEGADKALPEAAAMVEARAEFKAENSPISTFMDERCELDRDKKRPGDEPRWVGATALLSAVNQFFKDQAIPKTDAKKLKAMLAQEKGISYQRGPCGLAGYSGIAFKEDEADQRPRWSN